MQTIKLKVPLFDVRGREVKDTDGNTLMVSDILADQLALASKGNRARFIHWAMQLVQEGSVSLDQVGLSELRRFVEEHQSLTHIAAHRILEALPSTLEGHRKDNG